MATNAQTADPPTRRLGPVPWYHDGCQGLTVQAGADVPSFDDSMIRGALVRSALSCVQFDALDRALNRELWPLGYVAHLERGDADKAVIHVEIAASR
jgi:hypothetical protein